MVEIKIQKTDFEFMVKILGDLPKELNYIKNDEFSVVFETDSKTAEILLDKLSDVLTEKGFDSNDNPTSIGIRIEKIIDIISDVHYD